MNYVLIIAQISQNVNGYFEITGVGEGWALTIALLEIFPDIDAKVFYFPMLLGISILGAIFQFSTTKHSD